MNSRPRSCAARGFTLVELMVTLAIAAVLMTVAVPSYRGYARNAAVSQTSAHFTNAAQIARTKAMQTSRHTLVQVTNSDLGWVGGWRVYSDIDRDMAFTAGTDVLIIEQGPASEGVMNDGPPANLDDRGTAADGYLMFNPAGFPRSDTDAATAGSVVFYIPDGRTVAVTYSNTGRIRRCDPTKTGCR